MSEEIKEVQKKQGIASNPNHSAWTSASAGSGKTTVLTKRLLRMLLNGIEPSKILCITFTNTGAVEMKNRINYKLAEWTTFSDERLKKEIIDLEEGVDVKIEEKMKIARGLFAKILDYSNDFKILTIHSFCQQIIKRFPLEANIVPNFKIADEIISKEILMQAKDKLLKINDEEIKTAIKYIFVYKNEDDFFEILQEMIEKMDDLLYLKNRFFTVDGVINELRKIFNLEKNITIQQLEKEYIDSVDLSIFTNDFLEDIRSIGSINDFKFIDTIYSIKRNGLSQHLDDYILIFLTKEYDVRKKILNDPIIEKFPELVDFLNLESKKSSNFIEKKNNLINFEFTSSFLKIIYCLFDIYSKIKKEKGYLDYNDLIIKTSNLLNDEKYVNISGKNSYSSWINYKLDEGIDHLLIDEAQDTSPIQWEIVKAITSEFFVGYGQKDDTNRTIFVVGDEKQSIFSFQGAEPASFDNALEHYQRIINECGKKFEIIYLNTSFRSLKSILQITDEVFAEPSRKKSISKLANKITHNVVRKESLGKVELWPLIDVEDDSKNDKDNNDENEEKLNKKNKEPEDWIINYDNKIRISSEQKLAETIANEIESWFKNGKMIYSRKDRCLRPIKYSDIMILIRSRNTKFINHLIKQFNRKKLKSMGSDRFDLFDSIISQDIISLCEFILFNENDLELANILKSPFLNLTEDDLYFLCDYKNDNNCSLWEAIKQNDKYSNVKEFLQDLIEKNKEFSIYELFFYIFETLSIRKKFKERFIYIADDIIDEFLNIANDYEKNHNNCTLLNFIYFLKNADLKIKRDIDTLADEIKIMTIHASKGMEAPIVILPDTDHISQVADKIDKILIYKEEGNDYKIPILEKEKSTFTDTIKKSMKNNTRNEYLRLLYVAMTRAENELYICDRKKNKKTIDDSWYKIIKNSIESIGAKHRQSKNIDGDIIYIGDDDIFDEKHSIYNSQIDDKTDINVKEIVNVINLKNKEKNNIKIINPSIYYAENAMQTPVENDENIKNGKIVHKLLEILPTANKDEWNNIIDIFLNNNTNYDNIKSIVLKILNDKDFNFLFDTNSKAEVPIFGKLDDENIVSGKIDRLSIIDNIVYIVDYKNTNYLPKTVPEKYIKQLELYKKILSKIYTNKTIKTYILWTSFGKIEEVKI